MEPESKVCRDCCVAQPLDAFPRQKGGRQGRHPLCKTCRATQERRRYERDRARILALMRDDAARRRRVRWRALERKYGLSRHDYETLYVAQRGCCAICARRLPRLVVDHCHTTSRVRGLLCSNCNVAIGELDDDPDRCEAAADYLAGPGRRAGVP